MIIHVIYTNKLVYLKENHIHIEKYYRFNLETTLFTRHIFVRVRYFMHSFLFYKYLKYLLAFKSTSQQIS